MIKKDAATAEQKYRNKNQGILYVSAGLPGAGKSTMLKKMKKPEEIIVSRDEIRFSLLKEGEAYFSHESEVFSLFIKKIVKHIENGVNVYADATHLTPASQLKLLGSVLLYTTPAQIHYIHFNTPLEFCLERNQKRKGTKAFVPRSVIRRMAEQAEFTPCHYIDYWWEVDKDGNVSKMEDFNK